jgi:hypothetical protein
MGVFAAAAVVGVVLSCRLSFLPPPAHDLATLPDASAATSCEVKITPASVTWTGKGQGRSGRSGSSGGSLAKGVEKGKGKKQPLQMDTRGVGRCLLCVYLVYLVVFHTLANLPLSNVIITYAWGDIALKHVPFAVFAPLCNSLL